MNDTNMENITLIPLLDLYCILVFFSICHFFFINTGRAFINAFTPKQSPVHKLQSVSSTQILHSPFNKLYVIINFLLMQYKLLIHNSTQLAFFGLSSKKLGPKERFPRRLGLSQH